MYRIDNATAANSLPTPAAIGVNPNSYFTKGNPTSGVPATIVNADWANAVQEEICYLIEQNGLTLSKTVRTQMYSAIQLMIENGTGSYITSTTAANTYTASFATAPAAYVAGMFAYVKFTNHNTAAATINFNSLGAKSIVRSDGAALSAYDILDSMVALVIYDGTNFVLINSSKIFERQNDTANYAACTTAANTYTATMTPVPVAYVTGMRISLLFTNHNTGACTINLNSLGAKNIKTTTLAALSSGMIGDGMVADLRYDGTQFQLLNPKVGSTFVAPTQQRFTSGSGTYTTPANVLWLRVRMVGGGGGGAGSGTAAGTAAGLGGSTTFGSSLLTAAGGGAGVFGLTGGAGGGAGGAATLNSPAYGTANNGSWGNGGAFLTSGNVNFAGSGGGCSPFGGAGGGGQQQVAGTAAIANSGSGGGGGGGTNGISSSVSGTGGGSGGFIDAIIASPSATYSYAVGAAGTAGAAGTNGVAGGLGGSGYIEVTEYYQ